MQSRHIALSLAAVCGLAIVLYAVVRRPPADGVPTAMAGPERLIDRPSLEAATDTTAFIRWAATSVAGTRDRYGIVRYGTNPNNLDRTARSPTRWNSALPTMIFRVYLHDLQPATTYYFTVDSYQATGAPDRLDAPVGRFTTASAPEADDGTGQ